jgi:RNA polymerase sigma-70 factor (ECF subfamily)
MPAETNHSGDAALVGAARRGDRDAFEQLYRNYARMIHGLLLACAPHDAVEDLSQEVFLQAYRKLPCLRDDAAFGGWLAAIARNRAREHFRRRGAVPEELPDGLAGAGSASAEAEAAAALAAIRSLPEAYRETLVLRLVEGMTGNEISARTGLAPASVRVNLHRGMKLLRERLSGRREVPEK